MRKGSGQAPPKPFVKGQKRVPGAGRKKGTPNKFTTVHKAFLDALESLGGAEFLIALANDGRQSRSTLAQCFAKMLPNRTELSGPEGKPISVKVNIGFVTPAAPIEDENDSSNT